MSANKPPRKRASGHQMATRQVRIMSWIQAGLTFQEIGGLEDLTRERVRQIVAACVRDRNDDQRIDKRSLAEIRLEPALRLAAKCIVEGKLEGVDRLLRVLAAMEKHGRPKEARVYDNDARARLMAKLNRNLQHLEVKAPIEPENGGGETSSS